MLANTSTLYQLEGDQADYSWKDDKIKELKCLNLQLYTANRL